HGRRFGWPAPLPLAPPLHASILGLKCTASSASPDHRESPSASTRRTAAVVFRRRLNLCLLAPKSSPTSSFILSPKNMGATKVQEAKVHRAHVRTTLTKDGCVQRLEPLALRSAGAGWPIQGEMVARLKAAGLLPLARMMEGIPRDFLDRDLLSALVDRWNPRTHTFQFPWGEMGVSLKDVSMLLGLPIKGDPIAKPADPKNWAQDMGTRFCKHVPEYDSVLNVSNTPSSEAKKPTEELRGFSKKPAKRRKISAKQTEHPQLKESVQLATKKSTKLKEPEEEEDSAKLRGPTLAWLRSTYGKLVRLKELTEEQSQCAVEIYVLWLFGWVMFTSTHGDCVEPRLIEYAMDIAYSKIEDIQEISYGSAVLAGLYRANCDSCMRIGKKSSYVGCPLLLNLWSYEYLSTLGHPTETFFKHPGSVYKDDVDAPTVGSYWTNSQFKKEKQVGYDSYSQSIDIFRPCWVNWNPYTRDKLQQRAPGGLSSLCTRDRKFWLTKRNLIYDIYVEEYAPQRFMRQFDLEQRVPPPLGNPVPEEIHAWSRRRCEANSGWARKQSMDTYIETWRAASDDDSLWPSDRPYDRKSYKQYMKWYLQTDVVRCHQFVPQQGQSYTVPDSGYRSLEAGASWQHPCLKLRK
uniref:Aminotransferase-like plant mobile domain-containing protein n=3 Tax=Aegilops tauschii subsp. strangulata TaxID=200361 RepID=A0A453HJ76_AEGTS